MALCSLTWAAPHVQIDAHLDEDGHIRGTFVATEPQQLVDPLARLPEPDDPLSLLRTYPFARSRGSVTWQVRDGVVHFDTKLPRRWGAVGRTRRHGSFANGAWYPQPEGLPIVQWDVTLTAPDGWTVAVGDQWGPQQAHWTGTAERAAMAVMPRAVATPIDEDGVSATLLTRGKPRRALVRETRNQLVAIAPADAGWNGVIVEAPLRRRLARPGPGLAYVSDRAWRVTGGLHRFHHVAVARGLAAALSGHADPFERDIVAAALSQRHSARLRGAGARRTLRWASFLPTIDSLLYSRTMAFHGDILEDTHPADPVRDDLVEVHAPVYAGTVVVAQLDDAYGSATAWQVGTALRNGDELLPEHAAFLEARRVPMPEQDYILAVDDERVRVSRDGADGPTEPVVVRIDGYDQVLMGAGAIRQQPAPKRVALDPGRHLAQTSRAHDTWPARYRVVATGAIHTINLSDGWIDMGGAMWLRRQYETRNVYWGSASTNRSSLAATTLGYTRRFGAKIDGLRHRHALSTSVNAAWLNPAFEGTLAPIAVGAGVSYSFRQRYGGYFPLQGSAFGLGADGGFVPTTDQQWAKASLAGTQVLSPHPRHAVALRGVLAIAQGTVAQRLPSLGGSSRLRSIPPEAAPATAASVALAEYRWAPARGASVPVGFGWATELQLSLGAEAGMGIVDGELARAAGVTVGVAGMADMLGFEPRMMGVTAAWPVYVEGIELEGNKWMPELYLRWGPSF